MNTRSPQAVRTLAISSQPHLWPALLGITIAMGSAIVCVGARAEEAPAKQDAPDAMQSVTEKAMEDTRETAKPRLESRKRRLGSPDMADNERRFEEHQLRKGLRKADGERMGPGEGRERAQGKGPREAGPGQPGQMRERMQRALFRDIDLRPEQREQINQLTESTRQEMLAWTQQNREALRAVREEMQAARESGDEDRISTARAELRALMQSAPRPDREFMQEQVRALLTPEQAEQFEDNLARIEQRLQQMKEGGEGKGQGKGRGNREGQTEPAPAPGSAPAEKTLDL